MSLPQLPENATSTDIATALTEAASGLTELRNKRSKGEASETDVTDARERVSFINDLDAILRATQASESVTRSASSQSRGPDAAMDELGQRQPRTLGERAVASTAYAKAKEAGDLTGRSYDIPLDGAQFRTLLTSATNDTSAAGVLAPLAQPVAPVPRQRRLFVRDLMSTSGTTYNSVPYIIESNPVTTELGASATAEGAAKAEVEMDFGLRYAPITKITAWVPATTEIIEDAPLLQGYIDNRLTYMIALREEQQLLFGTGANAQIKGALVWNSGSYQNQTQTGVANDLPASTGLAIGKIENVDLEADGSVFSALDYWTAAVSRHSTHFDNGYGAGAPAALTNLTWGVPAIRTRAIAQGSFAVGAFRIGATILDRSDVVIRVGNQHSTYFTENKVAILAEERLGLAVHRPDAFVVGTSLTFS